MPDLDKLYEKADKYLQKQKFEAALETYQEILRLDPNDEEALINLGDLSAKINRMQDALRYEALLADFYVKRSDNPKAIATYRKVLKLAPQDVVTLMKLGTLLEKSQKTAEALDAYREALGIFRKGAVVTQMLECLSRIVRLDPNNLQEHLELAELAGRARQVKVAMPTLRRAAFLARKAGDESLWEKLVDQAHALDPTDESASIASAELNLRRANYAETAKLVEPILVKRPDDLEVVELACRGLLGVGDFARAQPLCWKLYRAKPERLDLVMKVMEGLISSGAVQQVLRLSNELKDMLSRQGKRAEFVKLMEKVYETDESNLEVLDTLSNLYNETNNEDGLRRSLSRLFNLYLASENYRKAGDVLERIIDVDPYGEGHYDRLVNLEGHIDSSWYKNIQARLQPPTSGRIAPTPGPAKSVVVEKAEPLDDLLVEGEMYHQYQLGTKLHEALEKIDRLYPGSQEKNQRVRELFEAAGYTPKFAAPAPTASGVRTDTTSPGGIPLQSLEDLRKIPHIIASINREATPQGVLQVAVNEVGRAMNAGRCWGAIGTADQLPTLTAEYCSPQASPSDSSAVMKIYAFFMGQATSSPDGWSLDDVSQAALLAPVSAEVQKLGIRSMQALPLLDKDAGVGLILLEQCDTPRAWSQSENVLLKSIGAQVVIANNNTKLRRLVRSIAGTDPETGLLPRSAYLECLLSEARRSKDQSQPLSVCLMEPENPHSLLKSLGDAGVQKFVQQVGKALTPTLRQNDISIRYSPLSVIVVFPDTALPQAGLAVEKVRRALAQIRVNGSDAAGFCAAVCDVPLGQNFDAVDGVTEVINRLEVSLDRAHKEGSKRLLISKFAG